MAFEGGYGSAMAGISRANLEDIEGQRLLEGIKYLAQQQAQEQQDRQRKQLMTANANQALPFLQSGGMPPGPPGAMPQPPMPGAPSQPMMPTGPAMSGGGGPGSMPMPPGAPASPLAQNMMGPGASPSGAPAGGAGASAGPDRWKPLPSELQAPFAPGMAPQAPPGPFKTPDIKPQERQIISIPQMFETLKKAGIPEDQRLETLERMAPMIDDQNKTALRSLQIENQATKAANEAYRATIAALNAKTHKEDVDSKVDTRSAGVDQRKQLTDWRTSGAPGGGRKGAGGAGQAGQAASETPTQTTRFYAMMSLGGDNSWRVGLSRQKDGAKLILDVDKQMPELAKELGLSAQDIGTKKAQRVALTSALRDQTKRLGMAEPFVDNFNKQADLVEKYMQAGAAGSVPVINKWIQAGRKSIAGDPDVTAFDTAIRGLGREHQRIVTGLTSNAQLHASSAEMADQLLNKDLTAPQIKSVIKVMREEGKNLVDASREQRKSLEEQITGLLPDKKGEGGKSKVVDWSDLK